MGTMLKYLSDRSLGDEQVVVALKNITKFHRNPNSHPGQFVDDAEQAFSLVAVVRAAMGYMLDLLPMIPNDDLMLANPNSDVDALPLLATQAEG